MKSLQRDSYFDFLRGLAIIFVVGIHTVNSEFDYYSATGFFTISVRQLAGFAVPAFLAISGFFLVKKPMKSFGDYFAFLKKQIPIVYLPCLFWSIPYLLLSLKSGKSVSSSLWLFFTCGFSVYYFIACIMQCYVLLPIIKARNFLFTLFLLLISVLWAFLHVRYNLILKDQIPLTNILAQSLDLLVFFSLGCWIGYKEGCYSLSLATVLLFVFMGLCVYETYFLYDTFGISELGKKPSFRIFEFMMILVLFHPKTKKLYKANGFTKQICNIGTNSFAIYLIHLFVAMILLYRIPLINQYWLSKWGGVLFASWGMVNIMKIVLPDKIWKFIGLR